MLDSTLLVTIRGPHKTLDLELPGDVAIGELQPFLLDFLLETRILQRKASQVLLLATTHLYVAGLYSPLPLHETLISAGVCNGTELELRTQESHKMPLSGVVPQPFGRKAVQSGVVTGSIGVTWESLL